MKPARFAARSLNRIETPELDAGAAPRLFLGHAGANEVFSVLVDVEAQLLGHPGFEIAPRDEHTKERTNALEHLTPPRKSCSWRPQSRRPAGSSRQSPREDGGARRA